MRGCKRGQEPCRHGLHLPNNDGIAARRCGWPNRHWRGWTCQACCQQHTEVSGTEVSGAGTNAPQLPYCLHVLCNGKAKPVAPAIYRLQCGIPAVHNMCLLCMTPTKGFTWAGQAEQMKWRTWAANIKFRDQEATKRALTSRRPRRQLQGQVAPVHKPVEAHPVAARLQSCRQFPTGLCSFPASSSSSSSDSSNRRAASACGDGSRPRRCRRGWRGCRLRGTTRHSHAPRCSKLDKVPNCLSMTGEHTVERHQNKLPPIINWSATAACLSQ